jgi:outer membrane protein, heavy metal efflux system
VGGGASLPLPVFDRNQGGIREAGSLLAKAKQQRRAAEVKAAAEMATAHQLLAAAANRASALKDDVLPRVKAVLDAVQSGYTQGKYSYLDLLDAQRTLIESRIECMDALISAHEALVDLERSVGGQLPVQKEK